MSQAADTEEVMYSSVSMEKEKRIPSFVKKTEKISAASKGTIIHKVFELLDFSKDYTMKSLNEDIERWISLGKLKKNMKSNLSKRNPRSDEIRTWEEDERGSTEETAV